MAPLTLIKSTHLVDFEQEFRQVRYVFADFPAPLSHLVGVMLRQPNGWQLERPNKTCRNMVTIPPLERSAQSAIVGHHANLMEIIMIRFIAATASLAVLAACATPTAPVPEETSAETSETTVFEYEQSAFELAMETVDGLVTAGNSQAAIDRLNPTAW